MNQSIGAQWDTLLSLDRFEVDCPAVPPARRQRSASICDAFWQESNHGLCGFDEDMKKIVAGLQRRPAIPLTIILIRQLILSHLKLARGEA